MESSVSCDAAVSFCCKQSSAQWELQHQLALPKLTELQRGEHEAQRLAAAMSQPAGKA